MYGEVCVCVVYYYAVVYIVVSAETCRSWGKGFVPQLANGQSHRLEAGQGTAQLRAIRVTFRLFDPW